MRNGKCTRMNYEKSEHSVSAEIINDSLWKMEAYRLGLFVADVGWHDATNMNPILQNIPFS